MCNSDCLLQCLLFGDFGLLTTTPRYLFTVLLPVMLLLESVGWLLSGFNLQNKAGERAYPFFFLLIGLGCTTAAIAALSESDNSGWRKYFSLILVFIIPCSSQLSIIATFAGIVSPVVFLVYLAICTVTVFLLWKLIKIIMRPDTASLCHYPAISVSPQTSLYAAVKRAFSFVFSTAVPFALGGMLISIADYLGVFNLLCQILSPLSEGILRLPSDCMSILLLNIIKRDFGSGALISLITNTPISAGQLIIILIMLTFSVPCFNSTIMLIKQEKLPFAVSVWLGSFTFSLFIGWFLAFLFYRFTDIFSV